MREQLKIQLHQLYKIDLDLLEPVAAGLVRQAQQALRGAIMITEPTIDLSDYEVSDEPSSHRSRDLGGVAKIDQALSALNEALKGLHK